MYRKDAPPSGLMGIRSPSISLCALARIPLDIRQPRCGEVSIAVCMQIDVPLSTRNSGEPPPPVLIRSGLSREMTPWPAKPLRLCDVAHR
jgi:hypothetical protein